MNSRKTLENFSIKSDRSMNGVSLKPVNAGKRLNIIIRRVFERIRKIGTGGGIAIEVGVKATSGSRINGQLRRYNDSGVNRFNRGIVEKEMHQMPEVPVMKRVMKESNGGVTGGEISLRVSALIAKSEVGVLERHKMRR